MNSAQADVSNWLRTVLDKITPGPQDEAVPTHRKSIEARLRSSLPVAKVELIGSHRRNTAVRQISDVDLMAVLWRRAVRWGDHLKDSGTVLNSLRIQLSERFPNTAARRDGQAVVVPFKSGEESVDVVPSFYFKPGPDNYPIYKMPDGAGGWHETAPGYQNKYLQIASEAGGGKLKGTARLIKSISSRRAATQCLRGFHVEMLLASQKLCDVKSSYADCVADTLKCLRQRGCCALQDPVGISGLIPAAGTARQVETLAEAITYMASHAATAISRAASDDRTGAFREWKMVFNA